MNRGYDFKKFWARAYWLWEVAWRTVGILYAVQFLFIAVAPPWTWSTHLTTFLVTLVVALTLGSVYAMWRVPRLRSPETFLPSCVGCVAMMVLLLGVAEIRRDQVQIPRIVSESEWQVASVPIKFRTQVDRRDGRTIVSFDRGAVRRAEVLKAVSTLPAVGQAGDSMPKP